MTDEPRPDGGPADRDADDGGIDGSTDDPTVENAAESPDDGTDADGSRLAGVRRYVDYAILAGLLLLAFVAVIQFYTAVQAAIGTWITREYRAPFRAAFNLVVALVVAVGISRQLRRMAD